MVVRARCWTVHSCTPLSLYRLMDLARKARGAMKVIRRGTYRWEVRKESSRDFMTSGRSVLEGCSDFMEVIRPDIRPRLHVALADVRSPRQTFLSIANLIRPYERFYIYDPAYPPSAVLELLSLTSIKLNRSLTNVKFKLQYRLHHAEENWINHNYYLT